MTSRANAWSRSIAALAALLALTGVGAGADDARARHVQYGEIRSILAPNATALPAALQRLSESQRQRQWPRWIAEHDRAIRARLAQGDEDTVINWMLFGGSFTSQPPAVSDPGRPDQRAESSRVAAVMRARARDLVSALAAPGGDERRLFARRLLEQRHLSFDSAAGRAAALQYLIDAVVRIATEQAAIDRELETARTAANPARQRDIGARIFRTRGLSLDTSLAPNYALDRALDMMKASGVLRVGAITRLAVIGPGLDFSDKDSGFDFYPQQTLQPFALLDSIGRLGVGTAADPEVVLLDISPRVIDHVTRATARAARGESYTVYLPLARHREWLPAFRAYWQRFGDQIGTPVQPAVPADISTAAELRAVRVRPQVVQRVSVADVNAVTDRLDGDGFDLMVATNVLVYYDAFDQALALANIAAMLRPGGILLSNNPLPDAPDAPLRLAGSSDTTYWLARSSGDGTPTTFGDRIFWYQRQR